MLLVMSLLTVSGCSEQDSVDTSGDTSTNVTTTTTSALVSYDAEDTYSDYSDGEVINLSEQKGDVTISKAGTYVLTGTLLDASVIVDAGKEDIVRIVLDNATIQHRSSYAIYGKQAKKVIVSLPAGTSSSLSDGTAYDDTSVDAPDACLYIQDSLTINGSGSLVVNGNYKDGITSKDTLKIMEGTYTITSADNGIKGRDYLYIHDGTFTIDAQGDALKTSYDTDASMGDIVLENGTYLLTAQQDGIQAMQKLTIVNGTYTITTAGGNVNAEAKSIEMGMGGFGGGRPDMDKNQTTTTTEEASISQKTIKAGSDLLIQNGVFTLDSIEDTIHSNTNVTIQGGSFALAAGDDGIHADSTLQIEGGSINISVSYEGLEGSIINIVDGMITLVASDDGINAAGDSGEMALQVSGGTTIVNAGGDGLDSNGSITMDGGTMVVYGPTDSANGTLDYTTTFNINGGTLIALGSSGMAQNPSSSSTQPFVSVGMSNVAANTLSYVTQADETLVAIASPKAYSMMIISSPALVEGSSVAIYTGGSSSGEDIHGYYQDGEASGGTLTQELTISGIANTVGIQGGMGNMGGMGGNRGDNQPPQR